MSSMDRHSRRSAGPESEADARVDDAGRRHPSRRDVLALGLGAFVLASLPAALRAPGGARLVRRTVPLMGTIAEIAVAHRDERWAQGALDAAFAELRRVERTMTRFDSASDVGRANAAAPGRPVVVSAGTASVLSEGLRWAALTDGRFDPCLGSAVALWDIGNRVSPPARDAVAPYAGGGLYRELSLDRRGGDSVVVLGRNASIDLGGIAKGYGVDRAVDALRAWGITSALVNVGGDLHALGRAPGGDPWRIGVRDPDRREAVLITLAVEDRAVATSGDYEQSFTHAGRRYHHLLDPATGEPRVSSYRSVTVAADTCMAADAAGTAAFGATRHVARAMLARAGGGCEILHLG